MLGYRIIMYIIRPNNRVSWNKIYYLPFYASLPIFIARKQINRLSTNNVPLRKFFRIRYTRALLHPLFASWLQHDLVWQSRKTYKTEYKIFSRFYYLLFFFYCTCTGRNSMNKMYIKHTADVCAVSSV